MSEEKLGCRRRAARCNRALTLVVQLSTSAAINYLGNSSPGGITQLLHTLRRAVVIVEYGVKDNDGDYERNHHT
jgi:hypothetical protein